MRLLNVHSLKFEEFFQSHQFPIYAVASHRWIERGETSYQDVKHGVNTTTPGYRKVLGFVKYIRGFLKGVDYLWIDTCCVNQDSDREVSEAVNSMFKWYTNAEICLAYLADVPTQMFERSVWHTRGWTLQELIAPRCVVFLNQKWVPIGHKGGIPRIRNLLRTVPEVRNALVDITNIPDYVLRETMAYQDISVDEKLSWMDGRETTRPEDQYYALLGLFGIFLPLIYGEGRREAKRRLLAEVHRKAQESFGLPVDADQVGVRSPPQHSQPVPVPEMYDEPNSWSNLGHHASPPPPWGTLLSPSGRFYYWNSVTGETRWDHPSQDLPSHKRPTTNHEAKEKPEESHVTHTRPSIPPAYLPPTLIMPGRSRPPLQDDRDDTSSIESWGDDDGEESTVDDEAPVESPRQVSKGTNDGRLARERQWYTAKIAKYHLRRSDLQQWLRIRFPAYSFSPGSFSITHDNDDSYYFRVPELLSEKEYEQLDLLRYE